LTQGFTLEVWETRGLTRSPCKARWSSVVSAMFHKECLRASELETQSRTQQLRTSTQQDTDDEKNVCMSSWEESTEFHLPTFGKAKACTSYCSTST